VREESVSLLRALVEAHGTSGFEQPVQEVFRIAVTLHCDRVTTDVLGNVTGVREGRGAPKVMLAGHADEIGFIIRHVNDEGFLYFGAVGGWDAEIAVGQRVLVHTEHGPVPGVIGKRAIHLMDAADRDKKTELHTLWIDIGARDKADALEQVAMGDYVTMDRTFVRLRGNCATAKSLDNRIGVWVVAETLRLLANRSHHAAVYGVSTVQEEIGLRGARTSAFDIGAPVGVAIDVCHATDYPDADKRKVGDIGLGKGPVLPRGANINPIVYRKLREAAREEGIPVQLEAAPAGTGTDANAMQLNQSGMATGLISVPLRYMHSPVEVASLDDLENCAKLLAAFCTRLTPEDDFTPRVGA
jgi:tetrahedral aminopeptidase